jgi:hypothetical protein
MKEKQSEIQRNLIEAIRSLSVDPKLKEELENTLQNSKFQDTDLDEIRAGLLIELIHPCWSVKKDPNSPIDQLLESYSQVQKKPSNKLR